MGYGLRATPAGVYVIKDGEVEWKPALDTSRVVLWRAGVMIVACWSSARSSGRSRSADASGEALGY